MTAQFEPSQSAYINHIAVRYAGRLWWLLLLPLGLIVYGMAVDWRWAVVGLMLIFVVYPMVMTMAVLRWAADAQIALRAAANVADISDDGQLVTLIKRSETEDGAIKETRLCTAPIESIEFEKRRVAIYTGGRVADIILLPIAALNDQQLKLLQTKSEC